MIEIKKSLVELIRPINCLMAATAVIVSEVISLGNLGNFYDVWAGGGVVFLVTAGGNVLNDYFDYEIDAVVHRKRPLPSKKVLPYQARNLSFLLLVSGLLLSVTLNTLCFLMTGLNIILLVSYEKKLKDKGFIGNIVVSYLVASLFLFGGFVVESLERVVVLALLAFLVCLAREIQKDIEDMEGDKKKRKTLAIQIGEKFSSVIAFFLLIIASALSFFPLVTGVFGWGYLSIIVPDFLFVSAGIISFRDISLAQRMIKTGMLLSIGSFLIGGV